MKKGIFLSLILLFALTVNIGCEALDVTKEFTLDISLDVYSATADINDAEVLYADSLSDVIAEYDQLIKDIEILELTFQITNVGAGNEATKIPYSAFSVADENGNGQELIATFQNQEIATMPLPQPLPLNQGGVVRFEELIKNAPHRALLTNTGYADGAPVECTVKFFFKIKMTANPL